MKKKSLQKIVKSLTICVLGFTALSACSSPDVTPVEITTTPLSYSKPILPRVDEISLRETTWIVVTESNYTSVFARLRDEGREPILYALTSDGYVAFIYNQADIIKLIRQQKRVIAAYENWQYWEK
jgi:hypothetical protein